METVSVVDLQGNPLAFLERVQAGERLLVVHQNRPLAELRPVDLTAGEDPTSAAPDRELAETYRAQIESALAAGWDDPAMDDYNNYDAHRPS